MVMMMVMMMIMVMITTTKKTITVLCSAVSSGVGFIMVDLRLQQVSIKFNEVPFHKRRDRMIGRGNLSTGRKPAPVPLCLPQIPHDPDLYFLRTQTEFLTQIFVVLPSLPRRVNEWRGSILKQAATTHYYVVTVNNNELISRAGNTPSYSGCCAFYCGSGHDTTGVFREFPLSP
jgi:hypothetical protein